MSSHDAPRPPLPRPGRLFWIIGLACGILAGTAAALLLASVAPSFATRNATSAQS